jgi:hypothetical protein
MLPLNIEAKFVRTMKKQRYAHLATVPLDQQFTAREYEPP